MHKNEISKTLKKLMVKNKLSARKLSKETGISVSTLSDLLNGRQPSLKNLQILSSYFSVSLDYIVNGTSYESIGSLDELDFEDFFEGIVKVKLSRLKRPLVKKNK